MSMGSQVVESSTIMDASQCNASMVLQHDNVEEQENPGVDLLEDLESYLEDINDRLTISRMVSDSVIKGTICAVEQEAAENIAKKEQELHRLKKMLRLYHVDANDDDLSRCSSIRHRPKCEKFEHYSSCSDAFLQHDRIEASLGSLRMETKDQFRKVKNEIDKIKGSSAISKKNSGSELVGLSGILQENVLDKWSDVDRNLDGLRTTMNSVWKEVEDIVFSSRSILLQWQQEREFRSDIEGMVMKNCIRSLQEEFEQRLWEQNAQSYGNESTAWLEKIKEISCFRQELDAISKALSVSESGQLISHWSLEHRKASGNHASSANLVWEGNGKHDESVITIPENADISQLKHLSKEELAGYFKNEMTKMKRQYELKVQDMTEELFTLKREYLKERGSSLPVRKDKELDMLRKKIPEVILKLDDVLVENEKLPAFSGTANSLDNMRDRLEALRSENQQLRNLLMERKKEIKLLSSQVSDAAEKMLEHSLAEANLLRTIASLKCFIEHAHIEASIGDGLYKLLLKEAMGEINHFSQESDMEYKIMWEVFETMFREATHISEPTCMLEIEDSDVESIITQALCEVVLKGALKEAEEKINNLELKYADENEVRLSLETEVSEMEKALSLNIAEKAKLEQEIHLLTARIGEKEKSWQEARDALAKEKEKFGLVSQDLARLRVQTSEQQILFSKSSEESQLIKCDLVEALKKIELYKGEICKLREKTDLLAKNLQEAADEKSMLLTGSQEKQNILSLVEVREREHRKQMDSIMVLINGLLKAVTDFECRAAKDIKRNSLRLGNLSTQLSSFSQTADRLKKTGLHYKQKFERSCSDLQKAEAEVDLLGDEVDALLSLLEKIYIALDHYSPILQHYPGIIEILKLVRRELNGESVKPV